MAHTQALLFEGPTTEPTLFKREDCSYPGGAIPVEIGEFWTSKQRDCHSIHEVSYRACYKPQLPRYFLQRYTTKGSVVYDPFLGRGTTLIEARLHGCKVIGSDINPLCPILTRARLCPPTAIQIKDRLDKIVLGDTEFTRPDLLEFYHPDTMGEIEAWRSYFKQRRELGLHDIIDEWFEMVCINRLTGHSPGFFSVYTLPPNQAVSVERQKKINAKLNQRPEYRNTKAIIWKKTRALLKDPLPVDFANHEPRLFTASADHLSELAPNSVDLVVTSPPFLDAVDYLQDNWLRMWFIDRSLSKEEMWKIRSLTEWTSKMQAHLAELQRILKPSGRVAFEVGEVRKGTVRLELEIVDAGFKAGLKPESMMINAQKFTKTSNCWGVDNNQCGTNSNRIVVFTKE